MEAVLGVLSALALQGINLGYTVAIYRRLEKMEDRLRGAETRLTKLEARA